MKTGDLILYWDWNEDAGRKTRFSAVIIRCWNDTIEWYDNGEFGTNHVSDIEVISTV